jgi:hypothetical protein
MVLEGVNTKRITPVFRAGTASKFFVQAAIASCAAFEPVSR